MVIVAFKNLTGECPAACRRFTFWGVFWELHELCLTNEKKESQERNELRDFVRSHEEKLGQQMLTSLTICSQINSSVD